MASDAATAHAELRASLGVARYALGITCAMGIAMSIGSPMAFLLPVLVQGLLGPGTPALPFRLAAFSVVAIALACGAALVASSALLHLPVVWLVFLGLLLFRTLYESKQGRLPPMLATWLLIAFTVVPQIAQQDGATTVGVIEGLVLGMAAAQLLAALMHGVLPDSPVGPSVAGKAAPAPAGTPPTPALDALLSTLIILPVAALFLLEELTSSVLVLVFVALLSQQLDPAVGSRGRKALILANAAGGIVAIAAYEALVLVPHLSFLLLLVLLLALVFGERLFSGRPTAPLYGSAFSTTLLIVGSTTTSTGEADAKAYTRILQLASAVLYVGGTTWWISAWRSREQAA